MTIPTWVGQEQNGRESNRTNKVTMLLQEGKNQSLLYLSGINMPIKF